MATESLQGLSLPEDISGNPFFILKNAADDNSRISAERELADSQKRILAETAWLPELDMEDAERIAASVQNNPVQAALDALKDSRLSCLSICNVISWAIQARSAWEASELARLVYLLSEIYERASLEETAAAINKNRARKISDPDLIKSAIFKRKERFVEIAAAALDQLESIEIIHVLSNVVEGEARKGSRCPRVLKSLIDIYEAAAQELLRLEEINMINLMKELLAQKNGNSQLDAEILLNLLKASISNWQMAAEPMLLAARRDRKINPRAARISEMACLFANMFYSSNPQICQEIKSCAKNLQE